MAEKHYQNITVTDTGDANVKIEGEITAERLMALRTQALKNLGKEASFDGFRKGHVPEAVLVQKLGEQTILAEAAELALAESYPDIVAEHNLDVVGRPQVAITKLAAGNPLGFSITSAVLKPFDLPNYAELAKVEMEKKEDASVSDEEVEAFITRLLEHRAKAEDGQEKENAESGILGPDGNPIASESKESDEEAKPLELTDDFVKTLGDFKDVADFKAKLKENLGHDKERTLREKKRAKIAETLVEKTDMTLPEMVIEYELDKMLAQFKGDIERMGLPADEYLKRSGKSEENMRKEWRGDAVKRAKLQFIFAEIAKKEGIEPTPEEIEQEASHILEHNKDADPDRVRAYVANLLANEKVFAFLEGTSEGTEKPATTRNP